MYCVYFEIGKKLLIRIFLFIFEKNRFFTWLITNSRRISPQDVSCKFTFCYSSQWLRNYRVVLSQKKGCFGVLLIRPDRSRSNPFSQDSGVFLIRPTMSLSNPFYQDSGVFLIRPTMSLSNPFTRDLSNSFFQESL